MRVPTFLVLAAGVTFGLLGLRAVAVGDADLGAEVSAGGAEAIAACLMHQEADLTGSCVLGQLRSMSGIYQREVLLRHLRQQVVSVTRATGEDCHSKMHLAGQAAGAVYGHDALLDGMGDCDDGFYHGAITEFSTSDPVEQVCRRLQDPLENLACWHGYGHLAWVADGEAASWAVCDSAAHPPQVAECIAGIGMEAAISHGAEALDLCAARLQDVFLYSCVVGAANNAGVEDPTRVAAACTRLEAHQGPCFRMAGGGIATHLAINRLAADALPQAVEPCLANEHCRSGFLQRQGM